MCVCNLGGYHDCVCMCSSVELDVLQHVVTMTTDDVSGRLLLCTNSADVVDS